MDERIMGVISSDYHDPFEVLGMHPLEKGNDEKIVVRAFLPDLCRECYVIIDNDSPRKGESVMMNETLPGLFEARIAEDITQFRYRFKTIDHAGSEKIFHDPYSFSPVLTEFELYLFAEGKYQDSYNKLGAHIMTKQGVEGVFFAVWSPNARRVSVTGSFNNWDGRRHAMRVRGASGIWEIFIPGISAGEFYKYEIKTKESHLYLKSDPYGFGHELRPATASIVCDIRSFEWSDKEWIENRKNQDHCKLPMSVYEVHLESWKRNYYENARPLTYIELADHLVPYVKDMGFTHVQLLPVTEYPFDGSWGYQVTGYFAPTSRYGRPEEFAYLVNKFHENGIGVIIDWVPAHFPRDSHGLSYFDGSFLYEHSDTRKGEHKDWGTLIFNLDRNEVKNFLLSSALFWFDKYHIDGMRVDAVASMLYLDYSRNEGEWVPNKYGGRENLEAVAFIKDLNELMYSKFPGIMMVAEESTAWPMVSRPTYLGGLGFGFKWNMGWMNDTLKFFEKDPIHRQFHQDMLTFSMIYAFHENFILVLSHDEVVHGKRSVLSKMPGTVWEKFANVRLLYSYMYVHPGKKLLFMGNEIGQWEEWAYEHQVRWEMLEFESHNKLQALVKDLNTIYSKEASLYEIDYDYRGFEWVCLDDSKHNVLSFLRRSNNYDDFIICVFNMTPVPRENYRIGVPKEGKYMEILNSDSAKYWGSGQFMNGEVYSQNQGWQGRPFSLTLNLPPLGAIFLKPA